MKERRKVTIMVGKRLMTLRIGVGYAGVFSAPAPERARTAVVALDLFVGAHRHRFYKLLSESYDGEKIPTHVLWQWVIEYVADQALVAATKEGVAARSADNRLDRLRKLFGVRSTAEVIGVARAAAIAEDKRQHSLATT